jgi:hypothetical protein
MDDEHEEETEEERDERERPRRCSWDELSEDDPLFDQVIFAAWTRPRPEPPEEPDEEDNWAT